MTLGKLQRSYTELPWMYRWGNLDYDYIVWNIKEVVSGNTKASTLILSTSGIWLQLPLNQKTVVMLQGNYSLIQNEKITMCSVITADQQSCDPTRLASSQTGWSKWTKSLGMLIAFKDQGSGLLMQKPQNWSYPGQTHINYPRRPEI